MWVSTSTSGPSSSRDRFFEAGGDLVRGGERQAPSTSRSSETANRPLADRMHGDVMHGERAVARDHHHAVEHGLVVERAGSVITFTSACGSSAWIACATSPRAPTTRSSGSVRLTATTEIDEQGAGRLAAPVRGRAPPRPGLRLAMAADPGGDARRRGVGQRVDGAAPEPPAGDADEHRDHQRRGRIRPGEPSRLRRARPARRADDHMSEPKCSASASSASLDVSAATR